MASFALSRRKDRTLSWGSRSGNAPRLLAGATALVLLIAISVLLLPGITAGRGAAGGPALSSVRPPATPLRPATIPSTSSTPADVRRQPAEPDRTPGPTPTSPPPSGPPDDAGGPPSGQTRLVEGDTLTGAFSPKSIVANDSGTLFAQNMMYRHTISVFDAAGTLVTTIPDTVTLSDFGIAGHPGTARGAPVEMAFSPDGTTAWVSNYSMYGANFGPEGSDSCATGDGTDESFLYRIDVDTRTITDVVGVGAVPKYVAITPDGSKALATNWCSGDLSVVATETDEEIARIALDGRHPRGIAVAPDSSTAYVALMGSARVVTVDLATFDVANFARPGTAPRHIVLSPDATSLYVTNNLDGNVVKINRSTGTVVDSVATGVQPRSMAISPDGTALYVVNYGSATMSKIRAADMTVIQQVTTDPKPIGVTYEPTRQRAWVASYGGTIQIYDDTGLTPGGGR